jgi:hypothetical protein
MALLESQLVGLFNDHGSEIEMPPGREIPQESISNVQQSGGPFAFYPYSDLIREHLANGRVLAARNLFEFARDRIPFDSKLVKALAAPNIKKSDKRDVDRSAEFRWLSANGGQFRGQWVALVGERLVASAPSLDVLLSDLKASPPPGKPLIHHLD